MVKPSPAFGSGESVAWARREEMINHIMKLRVFVEITSNTVVSRKVERLTINRAKRSIEITQEHIGRMRGVLQSEGNRFSNTLGSISITRGE